MKKVFLLLIIINVKFLLGQDISDYFIPKFPLNKVTTFMPDNETGKSTGLVTVRYYEINNNSIIITKAEFSNNKFDYKTELKFFIKDNEVYEETKYGNKLYLKLPTKLGDTLRWTSGKEIFLTTLVNIHMNDGTDKLAIKKINRIPQWQSENYTYFVIGIGFWKYSSFSKERNITSIHEKFQAIESDKTIPYNDKDEKQNNITENHKLSEFPYIIDKSVYDDITIKGSKYVRIKDTNYIKSFLPEKVKDKIFKINRSKTLWNNFDYIEIGSREFKKYKITFYAYLLQGEGDYVTVFCNITDIETQELIDYKELCEYNDSDFEYKMTTLELQKNGQIKLKKFVDKKKPIIELLLIEENGRISK